MGNGLRLAAIAVLGLLVSACGSTGGFHCDGWKPIRPTQKDVGVISDKLANQLLGHNDYGSRVGCWKAPR